MTLLSKFNSVSETLIMCNFPDKNVDKDETSVDTINCNLMHLPKLQISIGTAARLLKDKSSFSSRLSRREHQMMFMSVSVHNRVSLQ